MMSKQWTQVLGKDLIDATYEGGLRELVPERSGVYLWRRYFHESSSVTNNKADFIAWTKKITSQPNAVIDPSQLIHCVRSHGLSVGGEGLSGPKEVTLDKCAGIPAFRRMLFRYIENLSAFTPPVYIGEADNLLVRVKAHLGGATALKYYLEDKLGLGWKDVSFNFHATTKSNDVSQSAKETQELMELISQRLLSPFGTQRPG